MDSYFLDFIVLREAEGVLGTGAQPTPEAPSSDKSPNHSAAAMKDYLDQLIGHLDPENQYP